MAATTVEVPTNHVAMVSHPDDAVKLIETLRRPTGLDGTDRLTSHGGPSNRRGPLRLNARMLALKTESQAAEKPKWIPVTTHTPTSATTRANAQGEPMTSAARRANALTK